MNKKQVGLILSVVLLLLAASACQAAPAKLDAISMENVDKLYAAVRTSGSGLISDLVWAFDSGSLTTVSNSGAVRYDGLSLETTDAMFFDTPAELYAASPNGDMIAFSDDSYNIFLANITGTDNACSIYSPDWVGSIDFSPDGLTLLAASMDEIKVTLWETACGAELQAIIGFETAAPVYTARYGRDGQHIIWISRGTVQVSNIGDQSMGASIGHEDFVLDAELSPDGSALATAAFGTVEGDFLPLITLWDPQSGDVISQLTYTNPINQITFSPDGSLLAAVSGDKLIFWDLVETVVYVNTDMDSVVDLAFSPDGTNLAVAGFDGSIELWQVE